MSRSAIFSIILMISLAIIVPVGEVDAASDFDDRIIVHSHKTTSGMQLVIDESTKSAYPYVDVFTFYSGLVSIYDKDGLIIEYQSRESGTQHTLTFSEGEEPELRIIFADGTVHQYDFAIRKSISIKDLDPELVDYVTFEETAYHGRIVLYCALSATMCSLGILFMYHHYRKRAAEEVRPLG